MAKITLGVGSAPANVTHEQAVAGMIVWEQLLELHGKQATMDPRHAGKVAYMINMWENWGAFHMRDLSVSLGVWVDEAFNELVKAAGVSFIEDVAGAYDWEFTPYMLLNHTEWHVLAGTVQVEEPARAAAILLAARTIVNDPTRS